MLNAYVGQEVFALVPVGEISEEEILSFFYTLEEANKYIEEYSEEDMEDMRVLHGYLTSAKIIPSKFHGVFPYIIVENPIDPGSGAVVESDADLPAELASQIEKILAEADKVASDAEYEIENVFILYGYEITLQLDFNNNNKLHIDDFDVNDLQLTDARKVVRDIEALQKKHNIISRGPR
jgi:hypothetical protein